MIVTYGFVVEPVAWQSVVLPAGPRLPAAGSTFSFFAGFAALGALWTLGTGSALGAGGAAFSELPFELRLFR